MGIQARSILQQEVEKQLERNAPQKLILVRANPFTCTSCNINGRDSLNQNCDVCGGSGYLGVSIDTNGNQIVTATGKPYDDTLPPASVQYAITADLQMGHGLYGSGGDFVKLIQDLGRQAVGDASLFCKYQDRDHLTGKIVFPIIDYASAELPRPDRVISKWGTVYNIYEEIIFDLGSEIGLRAFSCSQGQYSTLETKK